MGANPYMKFRRGGCGIVLDPTPPARQVLGYVKMPVAIGVKLVWYNGIFGKRARFAL